MDHFKVYNNLITKARQECRQKNNEIYYESHHIIPRCVEGIDDELNKVFLTAKEHFIAHKLLTYIYPNDRGISYALHMMAYGIKKLRKLHISSRDYQYIRELCYKNCSGENHPFFGKEVSEEHRKKISIANTGKIRTPEMNKRTSEIRKGMKSSEETRKKISLSGKGRKHTEESKNLMKEKRALRPPISEKTRKKMSESKIGELNNRFGVKHSKETILKMKKPKLKKRIGKPQEKVICPYCKKEGGINTMQRWHFVNCKEKILGTYSAIYNGKQLNNN